MVTLCAGLHFGVHYSKLLQVIKIHVKKKKKRKKDCCFLCKCVCLSACNTYVHSWCLCRTRSVHTGTLWRRCPAARSPQCI